MRQASSRRIPAAALLALLVLGAAMAAACATGPEATAPPPSRATPVPSVAVPSPASIVPSLDASPRIGAVVRDDSLLAILPAEIDGVAVQSEPEGFAEAATDPAFAGNVEAAAFATAAAENDLASGVVARLRTGVYSEAFFRDWRDTYDHGACGQAGGVVGNAEAQLGGRTTYITSCAGGLLVYHAYVEQRGIVVSLISVGDRRFGEHLMEGLRP